VIKAAMLGEAVPAALKLPLPTAGACGLNAAASLPTSFCRAATCALPTAEPNTPRCRVTAALSEDATPFAVECDWTTLTDSGEANPEMKKCDAGKISAAT
jgi:hypothetical protein